MAFVQQRKCIIHSVHFTVHHHLFLFSLPSLSAPSAHVLSSAAVCPALPRFFDWCFFFFVKEDSTIRSPSLLSLKALFEIHFHLCGLLLLLLLLLSQTPRYHPLLIFSFAAPIFPMATCLPAAPICAPALPPLCCPGLCEEIFLSTETHQVPRYKISLP